MTFSKIAALASSSWPLGGTPLSTRKDVELLDQRKPREAPALMDLDCWDEWTGKRHSPKFGVARSQLPVTQYFGGCLDDDDVILPSCRLTWLERYLSRRVCMRRSPEEIAVGTSARKLKDWRYGHAYVLGNSFLVHFHDHSHPTTPGLRSNEIRERKNCGTPLSMVDIHLVNLSASSF
jgi:hypothetical protein